MDKAAIHYFTGTGNTLHAMNVIKAKLEAAGAAVKLTNTEKENPSASGPADVHIFAFPAYACAAPHIMQKYMRGLPEVKGEKAAVIGIFGDNEKVPGYAGQAMAQCARILKRRGFDVFLTDAEGYTYNWIQFTPLPKEESRERIFQKGDARMEEIGGRILRLERSYKKCSLFEKVWAWLFWLVFTVVGRRAMGKMYIADSGCNSCGKCAQTCPAKVIRLVKGKPRWNLRCEDCQRCINSCPRNAIQTSVLQVVLMGIAVVGSIVLIEILHQSLGWLPAIAAGFAASILIGYIFDKAAFLLELIPGVRKLFEKNFTKNFKRHLAPDFKPEAK